MKSNNRHPHPVFEEVFSERGRIEEFQGRLIDWFVSGRQAYPWRETDDPYAILVSELMLQQTRIATVLNRGFYSRWMKRFPDWETLAGAEEEDVLKAWEGLGYYNRARNLQAAAGLVVAEHNGQLPPDFDAVLALPGVGRYTAGAVMSFAFGRRAPIVDGNVIRVLARLLDFRDPVDTAAAVSYFWSRADRLTPGERVREYNSAIMELGQKCCTRARPDCRACPVASFCRGREAGTAGELPAKKRKGTVTPRLERVGLLVSGGRIFLEQETGKRRRGLWKLPEVTEEEAADWVETLRFSYAITRYRVELLTFTVPESAMIDFERRLDGEWFSLGDGLAHLPALGSPYRKAIESCLINAREELEW